MDNTASEFQSQCTQYQEPRAAAQRNRRQKTTPGIAERAVGGNCHREWKRRRRETRHHDGNESVLADLTLQPRELLLPGNSFNPLFTDLSRHQIEDQYANRGPDHRRQDIQQIGIAMPCHERHNEKVVPERQKQKRRIHDAHQKRPEVTGVKQEPQKPVQEV